MEIKLISNSPFFRAEQFEAEVLNGKEIAVMKTSEENMLSESICYAMYSNGLEVLPSKLISGEKNKTRKYMCVTDSWYIIVERGESGLETSLHYFRAEIKRSGVEITVTVNMIDDNEVREALHAKFTETEYSCSDIFNEKVLRISNRRSYKSCSLRQLELLETTEFIRLPYNGNERKIAAGMNGSGILMIADSKGYKHIDTDKDAYGDIEAGAVLYRRDTDIQNMLEIVKLKQFAKDFYGELWAVLEVTHTYPADAAKIQAEYPDFYSRECMSESALEKNRLLKNAKETAYVREDYRIGDSIIHIRVDTEQKELSIPMSDLQFIIGNQGCYGHLRSMNKNRLRLNSLPMICSLIEVERRFKLLYYKTAGFVKFGSSYYAELEFYRESEFFDSLEENALNFHNTDYESHLTDRNALICAGYLMLRGIIKPVVLEKNQLGNRIVHKNQPVLNELEAIMNG